jgi:hypothetical protein
MERKLEKNGKMEKLRKFLVCVKNSPEKKTPLFAFREGFRARMG